MVSRVVTVCGISTVSFVFVSTTLLFLSLSTYEPTKHSTTGTTGTTTPSRLGNTPAVGVVFLRAVTLILFAASPKFCLSIPASNRMLHAALYCQHSIPYLLAQGKHQFVVDGEMLLGVAVNAAPRHQGGAIHSVLLQTSLMHLQSL
ncbi:hypothetical protein Pelo_15775 [Pelomyxa schiedti]|nr:hypothetical protein Pelo_15775 [Pelomyxa schiedti]